MGIESKTSSNIAGDEKPKSPEFEKAMVKEGKNLNGDNVREASAEHTLRNPEPIREELVQIAVKFLSYASVRSSPVTSRRSFLEKKGLTKEEIDEAFRRAPDPPSNVTIGQRVTPSQDVQTKSVINIQPQATALATSQPSQFFWSRALLVVGLLAASGASMGILLKTFIFPRLKSWIRKVVLENDGPAEKSKPSLLEEVTTAAKAASTAASNAAKATKEMLNSKNKGRQYFEALVKRLDIQVAEMRSMSRTIWKLEGTRGPAPSSNKQPQKYFQYASRTGLNTTQQKSSVFDNQDPTSSLASSMKVKGTSVSSFDGSVRPSSVPASTKSSVGQHPKSYVEIMAMLQRGEIPPGIKEIDDSPPNPGQPLPNPSVAPRIKPWEVAQPSSNGAWAQNLGSIPQLNGNEVLPWWQKKDGTRTVSEPANGNVLTEKWPAQSWVSRQPSSIAKPRNIELS